MGCLEEYALKIVEGCLEALERLAQSEVWECHLYQEKSLNAVSVQFPILEASRVEHLEAVVC